jgi:hypothetical protein
MRASSLFFAGIAVALVSIAPANAQKEAPVKREKRVLRHANVQAPVVIYCRRDIPCRPVRKGCHLEQEPNGWNGEVCN